MKNSHLKLVKPTYFFGPVTRGRPPQRLKDAKARKHLTPAEVDLLLQRAKANRHGHRDYTMVLVCYRHGLRVSELCKLEWDQVDFASAHLHVNRGKGGIPSTHQLGGIEVRALRRLKCEQDPPSRFVFTSERGAPFATAGFRTLLARLGRAAKLGFRCHPHMLRHGCGFKLVNDGHDTRSLQHYLGHKNIHHTERYTALSPARFRNFWRD
jgi:type 1 fimbriae regulatory protein FimB/type 1 fimbriae regulatory protein FimE